MKVARTPQPRKEVVPIAYVIDCTRNPRYAAYVGKPQTGYLSTHYLLEANLWKTCEGAEKWLAKRPDYKGCVVAVKMIGVLHRHHRQCTRAYVPVLA